MRITDVARLVEGRHFQQERGKHDSRKARRRPTATVPGWPSQLVNTSAATAAKHSHGDGRCSGRSSCNSSWHPVSASTNTSDKQERIPRGQPLIDPESADCQGDQDGSHPKSSS